jgi:transposase-like protein
VARVDAEGEVLDVLVQSKRNKRAALKLMRKLLKKYGFAPIGSRPTSCPRMPPRLVNSASNAAIKRTGGRTIAQRIRVCRPVEEGARCSGFTSPGSAQRFLSA